MYQSFATFYGWVIFHSMEAPPSVYPCVRHLDCFHLLVIVPSAAVNMWVQSPLWDLAFSDFAYTSRSEISGSYGISIFIFLRNSWTFLQQLHYICEVGRVTRAGAHWEMLFSFPPQHLLKEPRWNSTPNISQPAAWCEKGWGSLEAAFFPGALPPTIAALSLFGNWSLEAGPKPTSSDIPVYPPKKQLVVELESRWPPAVPAPKACYDLSSPSKRLFREQRKAMKYIHMPIFLSLPASPGLWPQVCVPQEAPLKQAWGCKGGGCPGKPTSTHCS